MKLRYPFAEAPYACEHQQHSYNLLRSALRLAHYDLDNGYTVSILRVDTGGTAELWEAWAWPTTLGSKHALTSEATYHDSAVAALGYRNAIARLPPNHVLAMLAAPPLTDKQIAELRAEFERTHGR